MTNGSNSWGVSFSHITWFEKLLLGHKNLTDVQRHDDIVFEVNRIAQKDHLKILCCDEYTMGVTLVQRGLAEFGSVNIFYIGGGWCGYTAEAKEYCQTQGIGLFVTDEIHGALWQKDFWTYHRRDNKGNPIYHYRAA